MFEILRRRLETRRATKNMTAAIRRAIHLLSNFPGSSASHTILSDQEVMLLAANIGLAILEGQCAINDALMEVPLNKQNP